MKERKAKIIVFLLVFIIIFSWGFFSGKFKIFPYSLIKGIIYGVSEKKEKPTGSWQVIKSQSHSEKLKSITAVPYFSGYKNASTEKGVITYKKESTYSGFNLYVSGHSPKAYLMNMDGKVLHTWKYSAENIWPDYKKEALVTGVSDYWRRVKLFENGDLLVIFSYLGLIKIDKNSNLIWKYKGGCHHDFHIAKNGIIFVLTSKERIIKSLNSKVPVIEDYITVLNPEGKEIKSVSLLSIFEKSPYSYLMFKQTDKINEGKINIFHTNTIEVFDGSLSDISPIFKKGNVLISIRELNSIAIINLEEEKILWLWGPNNIFRQHHPTLLTNGNILLYDNGIQFSRILEVNPLNYSIEWEFPGETGFRFFSRTCGANQYLPNGNILITDTHSGRAFEVTKNKDIVWEWISPHRTGKDNELVASLFDMVRIEKDYVDFR